MDAIIIKEIHISNFGRLHDFRLSFGDHLTQIEHPNGWGKSTLAAFIKAMFYGLEDTGSKKGVLYEREKYKPWQGGTYGGSLTFQRISNVSSDAVGARDVSKVRDSTKANKTYRIERIFADKKKQDTYRIFDGTTERRTKDRELGTSLFGVNMDTFERSVFITLDPDKVPQRSSDIVARLGELIEVNDAKSFSLAIATLEDAAYMLKSRTGRAGEIAEIEKRIADNTNCLHAISDYEKQLTATVNSIQGVERKKKVKEQEQIALQQEYALSVYSMKRQQRERLEANVRAAEDAAKKASEVFAYSVSGDEVDNYISKIDESKMLGDALVTLHSEKENACNALQQKQSENNAKRFLPRRNVALFCAAGVAALFGGVCMYCAYLLASLILFALSALCCLIAVPKKAHHAQSLDTSAEENAIAEVQKKIDETERAKSALEEECDAFIARVLAVPSSSSRLQSQSSTTSLTEIKAALAKKEMLIAAVKEATDALSSFDRNNRDDLQQIQSSTTSLMLSKTKDAPNNDTGGSRSVGVKSTAQLNRENENIVRLINDYEKSLLHLCRERDNLLQRVDKKQEITNKLTEDKALLAEKNKRYALLIKTRDLLCDAQSDLQREYMDPMSALFSKYLEMIGIEGQNPTEGQEGLSPIGITADMDVTVSERGVTHGRGVLSDGLKDIVNICARLALADAIFTRAKPPIILDDPFVNLDDEKVKKAIEMVHNLSKERQVIYMVCHKSRSF